LGLCQQEPSFGQNEPRPSVQFIIASVCPAKALSCFKATVVAFGHCSIMIPKAYLFLSRLVGFGRGNHPRRGAPDRGEHRKLPEFLSR
jgi:hypothetical protein